MMQPERWQQLSRIFESALALEPEERAAYLKARCGADESLRREVELLIESHQRANEQNFINLPAAERAAPLFVKDESEEAETHGLEKGQEVGPYLVIEKLGAGGMGEVYLARDTRLERTVALKILPADVADDKRRMQRFKQEAKITSSLNQPNIMTIFEFGEAGSLNFIATEYIDGETLRQHLSGKRITLLEIIDISIQVVAALDAAHEAKIVHRDIKPENIMIRRRDHIVKVLDFGLAKLTEKTPGQSSKRPSDTEAATELLVRTMPGSVVGTVNYMSPEQARGSPVDQRTDLWSTGVVIYEMVAGRAPFGGATSSHTVVEIIEKEPPLLTHFTQVKVPPELQRIVSKALAKNTDERYQTARDMLIDLRNLKKRLDFDVEVERSASPDSGAPPTTTDKNVIPGMDSIEAGRSRAESSDSERRRRRKLVPGIAVMLVLVVGLVIATSWSRFRRSTVVGPAPASVAVSERKLSYWMTVQKYRNGRPFEDPFRLAGEINFEKDYKVKLNVSSPQPGYLYILNEGPPDGGSISFVVLFPSKTANDGLSYLAENQRIEIPQQSWFQFDADQGTEKLWLIFSANAVPELEAVKQFANPKDQGLIKDAGLNSRVNEFLKAHSSAKATLEKDDELKQTSLRIPGAVLVHAIKLEHH